MRLKPRRILVFGGPLQLSDEQIPQNTISDQNLIGGHGEKFEPPTNDNSVRYQLIKHCREHCPTLEQTFVLPENFTDWGHDARYPDLLTLETHLAQTSNLILIIPESPGSIAELGAFSVDHYVRSRIAVLMPEEHHQSGSFIMNAIIRRLREEQVITYEWNPEDDETVQEHLYDITQEIDALCDDENTTKFDAKIFGHKVFCIFQIIFDLEAALQKDIFSAMRHLEVEISQTELDQALYLLSNLELIISIRPGRQPFYLAHPKNRDIRIDYRNRTDRKAFNRTNFDIDRARLYKEEGEKERNRRKAIKRLYGEPSK